MAKEFTFILGGAPFSAAPVKLERKKLYGWSSLVATDRDGHICTAAYISPEDSLIIPSGAPKLATVDESGLIVKKGDAVLAEISKGRFVLHRIVRIDGNQVTLHLYEISGGHTSTWEWYTVDRMTGKGESMFSGDIDLTKP